MNDSRTSLRRRLQKERSALSKTVQEQAAAAIVGPIVDNCPSKPTVVASYLSHGGELDVSQATNVLRSSGWVVALPVCGPDASMDFCPWSPGDELLDNRFGIPEPTSPPLPIDSIAVVLVPGVGFDRSGARIGHGVGFYDRFFARCEEIGHEPMRLGIAHDLQLVELPPAEPWDVPMHRILTPSQVVDRTPCA